MVVEPKKLAVKKKLLEKIYKGIKETYAEKYEKIYDSVLAKDTLLEWMSVQQEYQQRPIEPDAPDRLFIPLILSKQLGHPEIRNSKHWKISNECYMCDKWKYSFIFYDVKNQGVKYQIKEPGLEDALNELIAS